MMISKKMQEELNKQVNAELYSYYMYLAMSAYLEYENYSGFSAWMHSQAEEEQMHAMKIYDYLHRVGAKVELEQIDKPKTEWSSPKEIFEDSLVHEKKVTKMINDLVNLAIDEKDHSTRSFLQWFVDEQVEEEDSVQTIIDKFEMIGDNKTSLYLLDKELGGRGASNQSSS